MLTATGRQHRGCIIHTRSCNTESSVLEDEQNNCPKHVGLTGIINKPLLLHLVGCLYYLYQWRTVKQISGNEIYLLIKYIKSFLWRVAKRLSYTEDACCLKVNLNTSCISCCIMWYNAPTTLPATPWVHYTTSCNIQSSVLEDEQNNCPKHVELTGIINKLLLLHLVGCLYYLYFIIFFWDLLNNLNLFLYRTSCIFITLPFLVRKIFIFYTNDVLLFKRSIPGAKG